MALITSSDLRTRTDTLTKSLRESVTSIVRADSADQSQSFDVFLSHAKADEEVVLGAKQMLVDQGMSVYVDWIDDAELDRSKVNADTAEVLRTRMQQCACLLYLHSTNSPGSNWMPWELGYFDGFGGKVGIFPVAEGWAKEFHGQDIAHVRSMLTPFR
jgi:hypothetical protein